MTAAGATLGQLTIAPDRGRAGQWDTWTVRFTVGDGGVAAGGGLRVSLPDRWHQWHRMSSRRVQATEPEEPFFVSAQASRPGVRLHCAVQEQEPFRGDGSDQYIKRSRTAIDGTPSRYAWVVRVTVGSGALEPGDTIGVRYGDRTGGSRGFTPPLYVGSPERVRAAVDASGSGDFMLLPVESLPWLHADSGDPVELAVIIPSTTAVGEPVEALVVALDAHQNPVWRDDLRVAVRVVEGEAELRHGGAAGREAEVTLQDPTTWGSVRVPFTPRAPGIIRLRAQSADGTLVTLSNPSRCAAEPPTQRLYWGDLHSHSHYSSDGTGTGDDHFRYACDVSGLEVYGNADHIGSVTEEGWEEIVGLNARYYRPGRFVTLVGYEFGGPPPFQHHNVFYRGARGAAFRGGRQEDEVNLPVLWTRLTPGEALTIPHHTAGFGRPGGGPRIDWSIRDDRFRRSVEIYSSHGLSEEYAPDHPLSLEFMDFTFQGPADRPSYVQDGWMTGQKMGVIASSDNHSSQPGKEGFGVMAVYAPELTREAVFDAIANRRTYGTTGSRMLLKFAVNGTPMGGECRAAHGQPVRVTASAIGTGALRQVEVLRGDLDLQNWQVVHRQWFRGIDAPREATVDWTDERPVARALYYLRARQRDFVHGRIPMAWTSPVWVEATPEQPHT